MTVRELIFKLEEVENKDLIVVMSRDAEGNGFLPLEGFSVGEIEDEEGYGDFTDARENWKDGPNALCLWPVD